MKRIATKDSEIFQSESGVYYFRGNLAGHSGRVEMSLKTSDWAEAKRKKQALVARVATIGMDSTRLQTKELLEQYIEHRRLRVGAANKPLRPRTVKSDEYIVNDFLIPFMGKLKLSEIDNVTFEQYCDHFGDMDFSRHRAVLTSFLNWCRKRRNLKYVPKFDLPERDKRQRILLTEDEIRSLLTKSKGNVLLYITMYLFMGMRSSEITKLSWDRVDLDLAIVRLRKEDTKTKKARDIPINSFVLSLLRSRSETRQGVYVFPNRKLSKRATNHMDPTGFKYEWTKALAAAEISRPITPHDLRATFELYTNTNPNFTDTQRERMAGAKIDVQKRIYLGAMTADHIRGLEESVQIEGMQALLDSKIGGNVGEKSVINLQHKRSKA